MTARDGRPEFARTSDVTGRHARHAAGSLFVSATLQLELHV
jgi:hypothetical protein